VASKPRGMSAVGATRILLLAGLLAGCAAEGYVFNWTVDGVKNYTDTPLEVMFGDVLTFKCDPDIVSNFVYVESEEQYVSCNSSIPGGKVLKSGDCLGMFAVANSFSQNIQRVSGAGQTVVEYQAGKSFYFFSSADGSFGSGEHPFIGGQCLDGLKMIVFVVSEPSTSQSTTLQSTISPTNTPGVPKDPQGSGNDSSQMFYESSGFIAAVVVAVAVGLLVLVTILLLLCICHCGSRKRSVNVEALTSPLPVGDTKPLDSKEKLVSPVTPVEHEDRAKGNNGSSVSTFKPKEGSIKPEGSGTGDGNKNKQDREENKEQADQKETTKSPNNRKKGVPPKGNRGPGRGGGNQPGSETNGPGHNAARRGSGMQSKKAAEGSKSRLTAGSSTAKGSSQRLPAVNIPSNSAQTQTNNTPGQNAARRGSGVQCEKAAAGSQSKSKLTADGSGAKGHTPAAKNNSKGAQRGNGSQRTASSQHTSNQQQTGNPTRRSSVTSPKRPAPVRAPNGRSHGQDSRAKSDT
jgi:hypothetical protein